MDKRKLDGIISKVEKFLQKEYSDIKLEILGKGDSLGFKIQISGIEIEKIKEFKS